MRVLVMLRSTRELRAVDRRENRTVALREPDDIGMVIAALLSEECRWITAQDIETSGGYNL